MGHSIAENVSAQAAYSLYGPMFQALQGASWRLESGSATVVPRHGSLHGLRFNVFETATCFMVVIVFSPMKSASVTVKIKDALSTCSVIKPGILETRDDNDASGGVIVTLARGTALVLCSRPRRFPRSD